MDPFAAAAARHSLPDTPRPPVSGHGLVGRAVFSPCGRYRWWLERRWRPDLPRLVFIGLNPSRADDRRDDPTLRRVLGFARGWGFGRVEVLNLFSRIATDPALLRRCPDPVGAATDAWLRARLRCARGPAEPDAVSVWIGWGNRGIWRGRDRQVLGLLAEEGIQPRGLGRTAAGQPRHPLYAPAGFPLRSLAAS